MNSNLMNGWTLAACIAILCAPGCKSEKSTPAEATTVTAEAPAAEQPTPERGPTADDRTREARLEAARKRRQASASPEGIRPIPKVRTVADHVEVSRKRIPADNYKDALDRLERAVGNLERALNRSPDPSGGGRPASTP